MKLHEIKEIQLDEGIKQKLAGLIIGVLITAAAHGGALDKNELKSELQRMTPAERSALKTVTTYSNDRVDYQDWLKQEVKKHDVTPEVKKTIDDKAKLKKITDELRELIKD